MAIALRDFVTSSKKGLAVAAMALSVFGMAANSSALAAEQCLPGVYNPAAGVKQGDCYSRAELNKAMKDRQQKIIFAANRAAPLLDKNGKRVFDGKNYVTVYNENIFTTTLDGSEGYQINSDAPSGQQGTNYSIGTKMTRIRLYNIYASTGVPAEVGMGELGVVLRKAHNLGRNVAMTAMTPRGALVVLAVDANADRDGSLVAADQAGNNGSALADYGNVNYSSIAKDAVGIKPDQVALVR